MGKMTVFLVVALLLLGSACSSGASTADPTNKSPTGFADTGAAGIIKVTYYGEVLGELSAADIAKLPQVTVKVNDTVRTGPTLTSVVDLAGVKIFGGAMVCGYSRDHSSELSIELGPTELVNEIIIPLDQGMASIFGPNIDSKYWNMAISDLIVTPGDCCAV
jgi:hypothetical protein